MYTERQKKLITSSKRRSLKATASKSITIRQNDINYYCSPDEKHLKIKGLLIAKKEENAMKLQKVIFQKSLKLLTENLHERPPIQNIQYLSIEFQWRVIM